MSARGLHTHLVPRLALESGTELHDVRQAYHLDGTINEARDNVILVLHGLTGSADAAGDWWSKVIGPGCALDTERFAVVVPNLLGSCYGTIVDLPADGAALPPITTRDQAALIADLIRTLGATSLALVTGSSLGGMVALELAATYPRLARRTVVFAAPAAHTAWAIGWNHVQRNALALGGDAGLALAREIAMLSYRSAREFNERFGRETDAQSRFTAQSYLAYQGEKLVRRFTPAAYRALIEAMDAHDVGRGRGGVIAALRPAASSLVGVGIEGDGLYGEEDVHAWTDPIGAQYCRIQTVHGHDAFLIEHEQVSAILAEQLGSLCRDDAEVAA